MAVLFNRTDAEWIAHLPFSSGVQRPTPYGPVDGNFYGHMSVVGDATGGIVTINGILSFDRKEDWIYIMGGLNLERVNANPITMEFAIQTGPLIPSAGAAQRNPVFSMAGAPEPGVTRQSINDVNGQGGAFVGLPFFGDKKVAGAINLVQAIFTQNTNTNVYNLSIWGWIVRYASYFRGVSPFIG